MFLCLSMYLSICVSIYYVFIYLCIYLLCIYLSAYLFTQLQGPRIYLYNNLSINLFIYLIHTSRQLGSLLAYDIYLLIYAGAWFGGKGPRPADGGALPAQHGGPRGVDRRGGVRGHPGGHQGGVRQVWRGK